MEKHRFSDLRIIPIRVAEAGYLDEIWPHLRAAARKRPRGIIELLDLVVIATKNA